jgi:hypothetical protein
MPEPRDGRPEERDEDLLFALRANALGGGGDRGQMFPRSDVDDLARGAQSIPDAVTLGRRAGRTIPFVQACTSRTCWYWQMPNGGREYYVDPVGYRQIGLHNHGAGWTPDKGYAGPCPRCGNPVTSGGFLTAEKVAALPNG